MGLHPSSSIRRNEDTRQESEPHLSIPARNSLEEIDTTAAMNAPDRSAQHEDVSEGHPFFRALRYDQEEWFTDQIALAHMRITTLWCSLAAE